MVHEVVLHAVLHVLQLGESEEQDAAVGTTKDVFDELFSHQLLLQLYGSISEVSLLVGGRAPVGWWPPSGGLEALPSTGSITSVAGGKPAASMLSARLSGDVAAAAGTAPASGAVGAAPAGEAAGGRLSSAGGAAVGLQPPTAATVVGAAAAALQTVGSVAADSSLAMLVPLEEEVDLVAIKFQGAQVGVSLGGEGFITEVAMAALTMDDLLVGARNPDKAHMAESSVNWEQKQQEQRQHKQEAAGAAPITAVSRQAPVQAQAEGKRKAHCIPMLFATIVFRGAVG